MTHCKVIIKFQHYAVIFSQNKINTVFIFLPENWPVKKDTMNSFCFFFARIQNWDLLVLSDQRGTFYKCRL